MITKFQQIARLAQIIDMALGKGSHESIEKGACTMELVSYAAGEPWSDSPKCASPVLGAFMRSWNDGLPDADRDRLLKPFITRLIGTAADEATEQKRGFLALDWLIRVFTPKWFDLMPALQAHAKDLRALEEIADVAGLAAAQSKHGKAYYVDFTECAEQGS